MTQEWQSNQFFDIPFKEEAPAKINLILEVLGRRDDGYHLLNMLNVTAAPLDQVTLTIRPGAEVTFKVDRDQNTEGQQDSFNQLELPSDGSNLVLRAYSEFCKRFGIPFGAELILKKTIPIGSGLGGGSSDAAAVIRLLARIFGSEIKKKEGLSSEAFFLELSRLALSLGADVPYLLHGGLSHVQGIGEVITSFKSNPLIGETFLLIVPKVRKSTANVFSKYRALRHSDRSSQTNPGFESLLRLLQAECVDLPKVRASLIDLIGNDLELVVSQEYPIVGEILRKVRAIPGLCASVSGSGTAIVCILRDQSQSDLFSLAQKSLDGLAVESFQHRFI